MKLLGQSRCPWLWSSPSATYPAVSTLDLQVPMMTILINPWDYEENSNQIRPSGRHSSWTCT